MHRKVIVMVKRNLLFTIVLAVGLSGCSLTLSRRVIIKDTMAVLPDGGKLIVIQKAQSNWNLWGPAIIETGCSETEYILQRPGEPEKILVTQSACHHDPNTELYEEQGFGKDQKCIAWTPGSDNICLIDNGEKVLLLDSNQHVIISLDNQAGVIFFGKEGQPSWASIDMCEETQ